MSNDPKENASQEKCPLHLIPPVFNREVAYVLALGAKKYGEWNWRETEGGVKASVYVGAIRRHLDAWWDSEFYDPESGRSHISHIAATCAILLDAFDNDNLILDQPKRFTEPNSML